MTTTDAATVSTDAPASIDTGTASRRTGRWIDAWHPEDERFWETTGRAVARRRSSG